MEQIIVNWSQLKEAYNQMPHRFEDAPKTQLSSLEEIQPLKLLSINKVSKILGIRFQTVAKLVRTGRIKSVLTANNKRKIPYANLVEYIKGKDELVGLDKQSVPKYEIQTKIDELIKEYNM